MEESLTQEGLETAASVNETTAQVPDESKADSNQETNSSEQSTGDVSQATAESKEESGEQDASLVKFAKGQGIEDVTNLSNRELNLLKIARDNQKAYRQTSDKRLTEEVAISVDAKKAEDSEDDIFKREFRAYRYEKQVDDYWKTGKKDRDLEPVMANILREKVTSLTPVIGEAEAKKYAYTLSRDLDTLYAQALMQSGGISQEASIELARQEERESIKKKLNAAPESAHAVQTVTNKPKINLDWIRNEYDSKNPEHVKMVNEFYGA